MNYQPKSSQTNLDDLQKIVKTSMHYLARDSTTNHSEKIRQRACRIWKQLANCISSLDKKLRHVRCSILTIGKRLVKQGSHNCIPRFLNSSLFKFKVKIMRILLSFYLGDLILHIQQEESCKDNPILGARYNRKQKEGRRDERTDRFFSYCKCRKKSMQHKPIDDHTKP